MAVWLWTTPTEEEKDGGEVTSSHVSMLHPTLLAVRPADVCTHMPLMHSTPSEMCSPIHRSLRLARSTTSELSTNRACELAPAPRPAVTIRGRSGTSQRSTGCAPQLERASNLGRHEHAGNQCPKLHTRQHMLSQNHIVGANCCGALLATKPGRLPWVARCATPLLTGGACLLTVGRRAAPACLRRCGKSSAEGAMA